MNSSYQCFPRVCVPWNKNLWKFKDATQKHCMGVQVQEMQTIFQEFLNIPCILGISKLDIWHIPFTKQLATELFFMKCLKLQAHEYKLSEAQVVPWRPCQDAGFPIICSALILHIKKYYRELFHQMAAMSIQQVHLLIIYFCRCQPGIFPVGAWSMTNYNFSPLCSLHPSNMLDKSKTLIPR